MWITKSPGALLEDLGYEISRDVIDFMSDDYHLLEFFMRVCLDDKSRGPEAARWIMGTLAVLMSADRIDIRNLPFGVHPFRVFVDMVRARTVTPTDGKKVLAEMWERGCEASATRALEECRYLDGDALRLAVDAVVLEHADAARKAREGDRKSTDWLVGRVMRAASGRADAARVKNVLLGRDAET